MALYIVHVFDELGAEIRTHNIECASDGEAINKLLDLAGHKAAELWNGERKLLWWPGRMERPGGGSRRTPKRRWPACQQMMAMG